MSRTLRTAVVGVGRMGQHHARIYGELPDAHLAAVVDRNQARAEEIAGKFGCQALTDVADLIGRVDAVSIAVPTTSHREMAEPLLAAGVAVLIEKPLADTLENARALVDASKASGTLLQVGHTERFNPVVQAVSRMGVAPKFVETHRISPFTFRSADVSVVLDMMIHDIDIVLHLVKSAPVQVDAVGVSVLSSQEDIANARVRFASGAVANLTVSRLALKTERKIRLFSPDAYLSVDYQKKSGVAIKKDANLDVLELARRRNAEDLSQLQVTDFINQVHVEELKVDDAEPLKSELSAFLESVRTGRSLAVSAEEGLAAMELAMAIVEAARQHRWDGDPTA